MIKKGIDIKLGTLKDSSSQVYPVFIKDNKVKEVFNKLDIDKYFKKRISILEPIIETWQYNTSIKEEFMHFQHILQNASLFDKFAALNHFNMFLITNFPNKSYNSEFSQVHYFDQPEKPITSSSTDFFIDKLYLPNAETQESHQLRLANFIKELGSSQIEELLISSRNRGKRHPEFLKIFENKFDEPTKYF